MSGFINTLDVLGDNAFSDAILEGTIEELYDNVITDLSKGYFGAGSKIRVINLPNLTGLNLYYFDGTHTLESVSLSSLQEIPMRAFYGCTALTAFILCKTESICNLNEISAFQNTPIANGTGYIYVPRALLSDEDATKDYRRATNWSTFANQFRALEDYTVDGTITGELDESKI